MEQMKLLTEWKYTPAKLNKGYTRQFLSVDLGKADGAFTCETHPISDEMVEKFTGGRGFGLRILWDKVTSKSKWNDPENAMVISGGPLSGTTQYPGMGKFYAVFLSPLTQQTYNSNAGGYFGPFLKAAGFDALSVSGKAQKDVVVYIDGD
jgi:aldehyde:ferredoxin oxidoreductase